MVLRGVRRMGGPMRCWDCGQELDTGDVERQARAEERMRIAMALSKESRLMNLQGEWGAALALEALSIELSAAPD